jgi:hypothetical protein
VLVILPEDDEDLYEENYKILKENKGNDEETHPAFKAP